MRQASQVRAAVDMGIDAIGMILHADSPRLISVQQAQDIRAQVPAFVTLVGVFVDCSAAQINQAIADIGLDLVQLHGAETDEFGASLNAPFIKAIRAKSSSQVNAAAAAFPSARALLLDPYVAGQHGGTGQNLDLSLWPSTSQHLVLAGGLTPENVAAAVSQVKPFAVDMNSGLETSPGVKDLALLERALVALDR